MKILFLDIDGVLNSEVSFNETHEKWFASGESTKGTEYNWPLGHLYPPYILLLNKIVEATDCKIVISSSWRIICHVHNLQEWLTIKGFKHSDHIIDSTGRNNDGRRGGEIQDWLDANQHIIKSYVVIDDDAEDIIGDKTTKKHPNNFVKTSFKTGLTQECVDKAIAILNSKD